MGSPPLYGETFGPSPGHILKGAAKAHKKKSHKSSENLLDGRVSLGHPAGVRAKMPFSVRFSIVNNRKSLGHRPVDPCLSRRVSQGHPAGVPGIFLKFMCPSLS